LSCMSDQYQTIADESTGDFRDRGSKFLAYAYPIHGAADWQEALEATKKLHPKARHHCYAFRIGLDGNQFRANDDGEPSGSAGRPILGQIDSFGLTNVFVVVVRYFGGTKLGIPGLINAYKSATQQALASANIVIKIVSKHVALDFDYSLMSDVMNGVKKLQLEIIEQDFGDRGRLLLAIPQSEVEDQLLALKAQILKVSREQAAEVEHIGGLNVSVT
ncbi:MAG: YigZ family protein, partial [Bacteroidota bacterium]